MQQTITDSQEWKAWRAVNDFPLSPFLADINDAELYGFFRPKHWRAFVRFICQSNNKKYNKLKININKYYEDKSK